MDDETRRALFGELLMDEVKAIREYVQDAPVIKADVHQVKATVEEIKDRLGVIELVLREHEREIKNGISAISKTVPVSVAHPSGSARRGKYSRA